MLTVARKLAEDIPKFGNARLGTVLAVRNHIISFGTNYNVKTHPIALMFARNPNSVYPHAEVNVILSAEKRGFNDWRRATLWIARVIIKNDKFEYALARPCSGCWRAIEYYGVGKVIWSIDENSFGKYLANKL